jgi:hypothetical protein
MVIRIKTYGMHASVPWEYLLKMLQRLSRIPSGDFKQEHCKINQFESSELTQCCSESIQAKRKDLGNPNETNTKNDGVIVDKGTEDVDPPCTNYRKHKMSDKENDAWTVHVKKSRVSVRIFIISVSYEEFVKKCIRIKLRDGERRPRVKISVDISD